MSLTSVNPASGEVIGEYPEMSPVEVANIVDNAHEQHLGWRTTSFAERSERIRSVGTVLRERADELAELMADEMGKPLSGGLTEVEKCAWVCDYYAEHAERFLSNEPVESAAATSYVAYRPLGVVLAVMPWNFPLWQVFRFAVPALMAGNAGVLKHASNVCGSALAIEEILLQGGCPEGLFRTLLIGSGQVRSVIEHPLVRAVTLTGSTEAGRAVAAAAGRMLKKSVLELGGSDAYVVLADADLEAAATACVTSRLINSGQSCIAAKRFVVVNSVKERFEQLVVARMEAAVVGEPRQDGIEVGPMARHDLRDELHDQVERSVASGARCLTGGRVPPGVGAFYPPTVLTDVKPGMAAYEEELFGPVAAILAAQDEADAIRIANDSPFGLGAAVFSGDLARAERIAAEELEAGSCFVNDFVRSDPRMPFGGIKESGYGRELASFGIREFVNVKTVVVQ